jgi:hypothetical protein
MEIPNLHDEIIVFLLQMNVQQCETMSWKKECAVEEEFL